MICSELFGAHGVTGLFTEGGPNLAEDMGALKTWMLSKMAWDLSLATDWEKLMDEFLTGYYGKASKQMRAYMEIMHAAAIRTGDPVKMFESSNQVLVNKTLMKYATAPTLLRAGSALRAAKSSVTDHALHLSHVEVAELPTLYVVLPIFKQVLSYARAHALAWPFASENLHVLLNDFVRVFNTTGDAMVDIHHSLDAFVALVRSNYVRA